MVYHGIFVLSKILKIILCQNVSGILNTGIHLTKSTLGFGTEQILFEKGPLCYILALEL